MENEAWMVIVGVALVTLVLGFMLGRIFSGNKSRMVELQMELDRKQTELTDYKQDVEAHFDKTASLFVSMAGSYKDLFDHLSSGSERISAGPARKRFRERVDAMLLGEGADTKQLSSGVAAAAVTGAALAEADDAEEVEAAAVAADVEPEAKVTEPADDTPAAEAPDAPEPVDEVAASTTDEVPVAGAVEGAEEAATAATPEADTPESDAERQKPS